MTRRLLTLFGLLCLGLFGCQSPIVGAKCRPGFTICGGLCVNLTQDFRNCGACGHGCGRFVCESGMCSTTDLRDAGPEAGALDGGAGDAGPIDASSDSGAVDGGGFSPPDAGGCGLGQQDCGGTCSNPDVDPANCGGCGNACADNQFCSAGKCAAQCQAPLTQCGGQCFDLSQNTDHCGRCDSPCPSGICDQGVCAGAIAGQAVIIGHDFVNANNAMQRLAGNAVFLARGAPVRVLVYRGEASDASAAGVEAAIDVVKGETGRDWQKIDAVESILPLQLAAADVLLIDAQAGASKSTLMKLGQEWANALSQFLLTGGVVVVFDAPSMSNDGTFRILEPAQIFMADGRASVPSQQLKVQTPGLGVAVRVPDVYMSATDTVHFTGVKTPGTSIVVDKDDLPVVVQRIIVR